MYLIKVVNILKQIINTKLVVLSLSFSYFLFLSLLNIAHIQAQDTAWSSCFCYAYIGVVFLSLDNNIKAKMR